jgi:hypothetical protein
VTSAQRLPFDHDQVVPASDRPGTGRLEPDEDAELRRLHMLRGFGAVAGTVSSRYRELRGRDRRGKVRDPEDAKLAIPIEKSLWSDLRAEPGPAMSSQPELVPDFAESSSGSLPPSDSATERVISDTREIFGELPQSRRGLGIFRR